MSGRSPELNHIWIMVRHHKRQKEKKTSDEICMQLKDLLGIITEADFWTEEEKEKEKRMWYMDTFTLNR